MLAPPLSAGAVKATVTSSGAGELAVMFVGGSGTVRGVTAFEVTLGALTLPMALVAVTLKV